jgi:hypothetical protein
VALYIHLHSLIQTARTPVPLITAFYAIKWFHDMNGVVSPTDSRININILEADIFAKPVNRKEPIIVEIILAVSNSLHEKKKIKESFVPLF